jgi:hypothetical protein
MIVALILGLSIMRVVILSVVVRVVDSVCSASMKIMIRLLLVGRVSGQENWRLLLLA